MYRRRARYDSIAWRGVCTRCGLDTNIYAEQLLEDKYVDARDMEFICKSRTCKGKIKVFGKMDEKRACHLADIRRRTL